jgi:hypothetical protein
MIIADPPHVQMTTDAQNTDLSLLLLRLYASQNAAGYFWLARAHGYAIPTFATFVHTLTRIQN